MLRNILPILAIENIKISSYGENLSLYDTATDDIVFNKNNLLKDIDFKNILEQYLSRQLSKKEYLIFCLLHELGHRNRYKNKMSDVDLYWKERKRWELMQHREDRLYNAFLYWNEITEEREAMNFAKHYFDIYLKSCNSLKLNEILI